VAATFVRDSFQPVFIPRGQREQGPLLRQLERQGAANAPRRTGDNNDVVLKGSRHGKHLTVQNEDSGG
jgi:hypothetical protein